jgi:hypothetical protein
MLKKGNQVQKDKGRPPVFSHMWKIHIYKKTSMSIYIATDR